jgi:DNA-binding MarR family transcriptional regulator
MELLKDVAILPTSGIVARYTRLGLSGRQGDKAKRSLLGLGLIEEEEKLTSKGRSKVVRLTESGKALLESLVKKDGQSRETEPNASDVPT